MIEYFVNHNPLITYQTSGDTCYIKNIEDYLFFCIIDIAGHGTKKCFMNAQKLKKLVESSIGILSFKNIIINLHKNLNGNGAVVLIGKINNKTGEYIYSGVGNISIKKVNSQNDVKTLNTQEGIIGIFLPQKIYKLNGKLNNNDYLFIHTDGIKSSIDLKKYFIYEKSLSKTLNLIMKKEKNIDDALGVLIRYKNEE